jgi:DNA-binding cell septation regulator SpoVG
MQITEITIRPTNDGVVGAYVDIVFDNCLKVEGIKVIKGPTDFSSHSLPRSKETGPIGTLLFRPTLKRE